MAFLYVTEVSQLVYAPNSALVQAPFMPPVAEQRLSITTSSVASVTFSATTRFVMVHTDAVCCLAWGGVTTSTVSAVTTSQRLAANETRFYGVNSGSSLAVIAGT